LLIIQGCKGASVESLKCTEQVELPVFTKGSGHRYFKFCKRCSDCDLKQLIALSDIEEAKRQHKHPCAV